MIATKSPILQMLNEKIDVLTLSPTERKLYESRMKLKSHITTISETQFRAGVERGLAEGKSLGLTEGEVRGSRQKALETAKTMLTMGYPLDDICKIAGLSPAEEAAL